nr:hypothetical protein [uncultured Roseburia sp.]
MAGLREKKHPLRPEKWTKSRKKKRKSKPAGSGRGKTFSQTRNIVVFGSEREKIPSQTREADEKKEKEEKK